LRQAFFLSTRLEDAFDSAAASKSLLDLAAASLVEKIDNELVDSKVDAL
jgi:hypothetical protein